MDGAKQNQAAVVPPDCVLMERDGETAVVNLNSIEIMSELGWVQRKSGGGKAGASGDDLTALGIVELKERATAKGLTFPGNVSKAALIAMLAPPAA